MSYTPLFDGLVRGSLHGKWPDIGLWPILLSLTDRNGVLEATYGYIAAACGLPPEQIEACIARFCEPDPDSGTIAHDGRRLIRTGSHQWLVVNHAKYREKARLMAKAAHEVSSGKNASRIRDRRRPPLTAADRLSDLDLDLNKEIPLIPPLTKKSPGKGGRKSQRPADFTLSAERQAYAEERLPEVDVAALFADFCGSAQQSARGYADWDMAWQTWVRRSMPNSGAVFANRYPRKAFQPTW